MEYTISSIAHIENAFKTKFGIPRQSGLAKSVISKIVFEDRYKDPDLFRGLEGFSHIWLLWQFSEHVGSEWASVVRPPRLGGNKKVGVFASRSPFRPNAIGMSVVKIEKIELGGSEGPVIYVSGADLKNETPIFDIKPYIPGNDIVLDAVGGYTNSSHKELLKIDYSKISVEDLDESFINGLTEVLEQDPRPAYHNDEREYGFLFDDYEVKFQVIDGMLSVISIEKV